MTTSSILIFGRQFLFLETLFRVICGKQFFNKSATRFAHIKGSTGRASARPFLLLHLGRCHRWVCAIESAHPPSCVFDRGPLLVQQQPTRTFRKSSVR